MIISELSGCEWSSHSSSLLCEAIALAGTASVGMIVRDAITGVKLSISELVETVPDSDSSVSCSIAVSDLEVSIPDFSSVSVLDFESGGVGDCDSLADPIDGESRFDGSDDVSGPGNQCTAFVKHLWHFCTVEVWWIIIRGSLPVGCSTNSFSRT